MFQNIILQKYNNSLEEQFIKLSHKSNLPLYFNKTGNKEFTNYQREFNCTMNKEISVAFINPKVKQEWEEVIF